MWFLTILCSRRTATHSFILCADQDKNSSKSKIAAKQRNQRKTPHTLFRRGGTQEQGKTLPRRRGLGLYCAKIQFHDQDHDTPTTLPCALKHAPHLSCPRLDLISKLFTRGQGQGQDQGGVSTRARQNITKTKTTRFIVHKYNIS